MANITVIGTGYVGLVTGACFANYGHYVRCFDIDNNKIKQLNAGISPIYEDNIEDFITKNTKNKHLMFDDNLDKALDKTDVIFITVSTPQDDNNRVNMQYYYHALDMIAQSHANHIAIVNKSTVEVGTAKKANDYLQKNYPDKIFYMISNPEFLREGTAIYDFIHADRIILGFADTTPDDIKDLMRHIYASTGESQIPIIETDCQTAELIKYSANAFLAMKIAYINQIADLCEKANANINHVAYGLGSDKRIGDKFLNVSPGYGGSCFPKDTNALVEIGKDYDCDLTIIKSVICANNERKKQLAYKAINIINKDNAHVTILGLAFKANTNDMRESPAIDMIDILYQHGLNVTVHDPVAMDNAKKIISYPIRWCDDIQEAIHHQDAIIIMTEWQDYRNLTAKFFKQHVPNVKLLDFRNIYDKRKMYLENINYYCLG